MSSCSTSPISPRVQPVIVEVLSNQPINVEEDNCSDSNAKDIQVSQSQNTNEDGNCRESVITSSSHRNSSGLLDIPSTKIAREDILSKR